MEFESLVGFNCTLKTYQLGGLPKLHSCKLSLGIFRQSHRIQPCFQIEGVGFGKPRRIKFSLSNLGTVAAQRVSEGCLSITLHELMYETLKISDVRDKQALNRMYEILQSIFNGTFSRVNSTGSDLKSPVGKTPLPVLVNRRSPYSASNDKKKKRLSTVNPANWRGASMVSAALQAQQDKPSVLSSSRSSSFYGSGNTPPPDTFHPHTTSTQRGDRLVEKPFTHSARRNLALDLKELPSTTDIDDFQELPNFRFPDESSHHSQRPPLSSLSTQQARNGVTSSGGLKHLSGPDTDTDGFANLGNTCYMNAVLQSLLGLHPFSEDLLLPYLVKSVHPKSLYRMMVLLLKCKRSKESFESQCILLKRIKGVISFQTQKFTDFRQQDAHELLSQCLDQLKDDVYHLCNHGDTDSSNLGNTEVAHDSHMKYPCPVINNFESTIEHRIVCDRCGLVTCNAQLNYDFPLQLPNRVLHKSNEQANLQLLFDQFFSEEVVEFNCTRCLSKSATLSHKLTALPRVLIVHLKRYGYSSELLTNSKRVDNVRIPRYINIGHLCQEQCRPPSSFTGPLARDVWSEVQQMCEDKENLPASESDHIEQVSSDTNANVDEANVTDVSPTVLNVRVGPIKNTHNDSAISLTLENSSTLHSTIHTTHTPTNHTTHVTDAAQRCDLIDDVILVSDADDAMADSYLCNVNNSLKRQATMSEYEKITRSCDHTAKATKKSHDHTAKSHGQTSLAVSEPDPPSILGKRKQRISDSNLSDIPVSYPTSGHLVESGNKQSISGPTGFSMSGPSGTCACSEDGCSTTNAGTLKSLLMNEPLLKAHDNTLDISKRQTNSSRLASETTTRSHLAKQEPTLDTSLEEFDNILCTAPPELLLEHGFENNHTPRPHDHIHCPCGHTPCSQGPCTDNDSKTTFDGTTQTVVYPCSSNPSPGLLQVYSTSSVSGENSQPHTSNRSSIAPPTSAHPSELAVEEVEKPLTDSTAINFDYGEDEFQRAVEESLRSQQSSEYHVQGMSEDDQLRLALELSIQESLPPDALSVSVAMPSASSPCQEQTTQRGQATPTPEKSSLEAYRLMSIVNHIGQGSTGGHYISDVYSFPDHVWKVYNDSKVSEMREEDVRQRRQTTGYIFFFMHRSIFNSVSAQFGRH